MSGWLNEHDLKRIQQNMINDMAARRSKRIAELETQLAEARALADRRLAMVASQAEQLCSIAKALGAAEEDTPLDAAKRARALVEAARTLVARDDELMQRIIESARYRVEQGGTDSRIMLAVRAGSLLALLEVKE